MGELKIFPASEWSQDLEKIKPGLYADVPEDIYHSSPGISYSGLKKIDKSPWEYKYGKPLKSEALRFGKMVHEKLLEPELFNKKYYVVPDIRRGTKEWKKYEEAAPFKELIKETEIDWLLQMEKNIHQTTYGSIILNAFGYIEVSGYFYINGVLARFRVDKLIPEPATLIIGDLKKINPKSGYLTEQDIIFQSKMYKYHWQAAFYKAALEQLTGIPSLFANLFAEQPSESKLGTAATLGFGYATLEKASEEMNVVIDKHKFYEANGYPNQEKFIANNQFEAGYIQSADDMPEIDLF